MRNKFPLFVAMVVLLFSMIGTQAQGNSCAGLAHANGRGNTSAVAEAHNCNNDSNDTAPEESVPQTSDSPGNSGNHSNSNNHGNSGNHGHSSNGEGHGANPDHPSVNPQAGGPRPLAGAGCHGLENALNSMPETSAGRDAVHEQYVRHGCFVDEDEDGVDDREDNCLGLNNPDQDDFDGDGVGDDCDEDADNDGASNDGDCQPLNPDVHPGAEEIVGDGIDNNCDGVIDIVLGTGDVQVTLSWTSSADLDIHVTGPNGVEIYWGNPVDETTDGQLDFDANRDCLTDSSPNSVENIFWPDGQAPTGEYEVFVDMWNNCGDATNWQLTVIVGGEVALAVSGTGDSMIFTFLA